MRTIFFITLLAVVGCGTNAVEPDNTKVNARDRDEDAKTPIDQKENSQDVNITADIRRAVLDQKDFSVAARNVKIITADGVVTLRGPVQSEAEKATIAALAKGASGVKSVVDELEVAAE